MINKKQLKELDKRVITFKSSEDVDTNMVPTYLENRVLTLTEEEYKKFNTFKDLKKIYKKLNLNNITVKKTGKFEFIHLCRIENFKFIIKNNSFLTHYKKNISNLGKGTYVIKKNDLFAFKILFNEFITRRFALEKQICVCNGEYEGEYEERVFPYPFFKEIVIRKDIKIKNIKVYKREEFYNKNKYLFTDFEFKILNNIVKIEDKLKTIYNLDDKLKEKKIKCNFRLRLVVSIIVIVLNRYIKFCNRQLIKKQLVKYVVI